MTAWEILLVEDNPGDVVLVHEAFREAGILTRIHVATDGEQAIAFIRNAAPYQSAARPDLILLDWNLPRRSGCEVLTEIKNHPDTCQIPVIVLTTSSDDGDINAAYKRHANCFLTKPVDVEGFFGIIRSIDQFWFRVAKLPQTVRTAAAG